MKKWFFFFAMGYLVVAAILGTLTGAFVILEWSATTRYESQAIQTPAELDLAPELAPYTMFRPQTSATLPPVHMPSTPGDPTPGIMEINEHGFRYGPLAKEKPAGTLRIFVLGGSVVFYGHTNQTTISGYLETRLREKYPNTPVEVINAGVTGYISDQEWVLLATSLTEFSPDAIIVFDGFNDFLMPSSMEQRLGYPFKFKTLELAWYDSKQLLRRLLALPFSAHLKAGSHVLRRYNPDWSYITYLRGDRIGPASDAPVPTADEVAAHLVNNWRKMAQFATACQIKGLFVLQPFHQQGNLFGEQYDAAEQRITMLAQEFAAWQTMLQFTSFRHVMEPRHDLFYDQVHTYDEGNAIYANLLLERLAPLGI